MGRPSNYDPSMCDQVMELMGEHGLSRKAAAKELGISYNTFLSYIKQHDDFREAVDEGDVLAEVFWQTQFEKGARGLNREVNPTMMIFYMKNRFNWRDKHDVDHNVEKLPTLDEWLAEQEAKRK